MGQFDLGLKQGLALSDQQEVFDYWQSLRAQGAMPRKQDFVPKRLLRRLPTVSLIEVCGQNGSARFRVRLAGTGLRKEFGAEITGRFLDDPLFGACSANLIALHKAVAESGEPAQGVARLNWAGRPHQAQVFLRLPFSDDGKTVNVILGYDRFVPVDRNAARAVPAPSADAERLSA